jgi:hypothetical protein
MKVSRSELCDIKDEGELPHPPVRSVNLGIFSQLPFRKGGMVFPPFIKGRWGGIL